jgi:nitroreductase
MNEPLTPTDDLRVVETRLHMPLAEAMRTQRAVRRVLPDPVEDDIILRCLELALEAPTGSNRQNWEFVIVKSHAVKAALARQYRRIWAVYGGGVRRAADDRTTKIMKSVDWQVRHFEQIPVLIVCCLKRAYWQQAIPQPPVALSSYYGSIYPSVQNLLLAARSIGLAGALITLPLWADAEAHRILHLPLTVDPCCIVTLGWPIGRYGRKGRKRVGNVVHLDHYGRQPWLDGPSG